MDCDRYLSNIMNSICKSVCIACALLLCACGGDHKTDIAEPTPPPQPAGSIQAKDFAGEWHLTEWSVDKEFAAEVYLRLNEDLTFVLYQNIVSHGFQQLPGTFLFDAATSTVSGQYNDGTPWGYSYTITLLTEQTMKWQAAGTNDISTYTRTTIPDLTVVRSSQADSSSVIPFL